jgi:hypothetical protein
MEVPMSFFRRVAVVVTLISLMRLCDAVAQDKLPLPDLSDSLRNELSGYLQAHWQTPEQYVISKFADHDIVILGEQHRARHDPILVQTLIPLLYENGIYTLGFEFARRIDQPLIDSLLGGTTYDQQLTNEILLRNFVHWGYQEYADIFKAAWQVNQRLRAGERRFRILGLNNSPDWSFVRTEADRDNREVRQKVWHGETERDWAGPFLDEVIAKKEKALVYCGIHHGFSEYRQPLFFDGKFEGFVEDRFGRYLYNEIGKKVITIYLHGFWNGVAGWNAGFVYPADGFIDALMATVDSTHWRVGFDVKGTPFAKLTGKTGIYSNGYPDFNLGTFCDGYIFQKPISRYEPINCIEGYYTEKNIDYARRNALNPWFRDKEIKEFEGSCEESRQENLRWWGKLR